MLLHHLLEDSAQRFPHKEALVCDDHRLEYAALDDLSNRIANALIALGLERGGRVVLYLEQGVAVAGAVFAISKAGGVFVIVDPRVKAAKLAYVVGDSQAKVVITDSRRALDLRQRCPQVERILVTDQAVLATGNADTRFHDFWQVVAACSSVRPQPRTVDLDLCSLIYTSGSSGTPKGVMLTHLNMISAVNSIAGYLELRCDDRILNLSPLSFDYGLYNILLACRVAATVILAGPFFSPQQIIHPIKNERVTGLPLVPTMIAMLLRVRNLERYDFSTVRYITSTGQALLPRHSLRLAALFPTARIYSMYGLTECKRVSYLPPNELLRRPASVGKSMPNTEAYIVDESGRRIDTPGRIGELVIRGANVMEGYWNQPKETARVIRGVGSGDRRLYSGDLFTQDAQGYLYFIGRKDDLIKSGGERVSPKEVEMVVSELDEIVEAVVIGIDDEILGQALKLIVVLETGAVLTEQEILRHCAERLEPSHLPRMVEIRDRLPRTHSGKLDRRTLSLANASLASEIATREPGGAEQRRDVR